MTNGLFKLDVDILIPRLKPDHDGERRVDQGEGRRRRR
jgi:hypothetical protein